MNERQILRALARVETYEPDGTYTVRLFASGLTELRCGAEYDAVLTEAQAEAPREQSPRAGACFFCNAPAVSRGVYRMRGVRRGYLRSVTACDVHTRMHGLTYTVALGVR